MLGVWMYAWDEADWTGTPAPSPSPSDEFFGLLLALRWSGTPAPTPTPTPPPAPEAGRSNAGGGHRKERYYSADPDFWEVRERYLRRFTKSINKTAGIEKTNSPDNEIHVTLTRPPGRGVPTPTPAPLDPLPAAPADFGPTLLLQQALQAALARARLASTPDELQQLTQRAQQLALDISKIQKQYYDRAISILLLDVF